MEVLICGFSSQVALKLAKPTVPLGDFIKLVSFVADDEAK
jgi:hypothetical protein